MSGRGKMIRYTKGDNMPVSDKAMTPKKVEKNLHDIKKSNPINPPKGSIIKGTK